MKPVLEWGEGAGRGIVANYVVITIGFSEKFLLPQKL